MPITYQHKLYILLVYFIIAFYSLPGIDKIHQGIKHPLLIHGKIRNLDLFKWKFYHPKTIEKKSVSV